MTFTQKNSQVLHSFDIALRPGHYKTILPNLSYPSRPNLHIPWSGSSAPLHFSVRLCFFSFFPVALPFASQKTTRPEMTIATSIPNGRVSYTFSWFQFWNYVKTLILSQLQIPITSNTSFDNCSLPQAFHRINLLIWVKLTGIFMRAAFLIIIFVLGSGICSATCQSLFESSHWSSKNYLTSELGVPSSWPVFELRPTLFSRFTFPLSLKVSTLYRTRFAAFFFAMSYYLKFFISIVLWLGWNSRNIFTGKSFVLVWTHMSILSGHE